MSLKPILYSTPMVKAIAADLKTATRRLKGLEEINQDPDQWQPDTAAFQFNIYGKLTLCFENLKSHELKHINLPYGPIGGQLYIRESFLILEPEHCHNGFKSRFVYKADCEAESEEIRLEYIKAGYPYKWKPSIHMPKEAARYFLNVVNITAERLKSITEAQAEEEGIRAIEPGIYKDYTGKLNYVHTAKESFFTLWEKINGKASLDLNPWVWVYNFIKK